MDRTALDDYVEALVAEAPPLTDEQRATIAAALGCGGATAA